MFELQRPTLGEWSGPRRPPLALGYSAATLDGRQANAWDFIGPVPQAGVAKMGAMRFQISLRAWALFVAYCAAFLALGKIIARTFVIYHP